MTQGLQPHKSPRSDCCRTVRPLKESRDGHIRRRYEAEKDLRRPKKAETGNPMRLERGRRRLILALGIKPRDMEREHVLQSHRQEMEILAHGGSGVLRMCLVGKSC